MLKNKQSRIEIACAQLNILQELKYNSRRKQMRQAAILMLTHQDQLSLGDILEQIPTKYLLKIAKLTAQSM